AANSTVPPCLVTCPLGDIHQVIIVRDLANNPLLGVAVVFDFSGCPGAFLCQARPNDPYTLDPVNRTFGMTTDASGRVQFPMRVGGTGAAGSVKLFASGILLGDYALASPDQNGNGVGPTILDNDAALFALKLGLVDPTADFDCSGGPVDAADQVIFNFHGAHT